PYYGFRLDGGFTVLDPTHSSAVGHMPLRVAKKSAFGLLQFDHSALILPRDHITLSLAYTFVRGRQDISPAGTVATSNQYHRFDTTATYDARVPWNFLHNEEVFARVSNTFDREYAEVLGFPSPPVNFVAGIKLELQ